MSWTILATSIGDTNLDSYTVSSDCTSPVTEGLSIVISGDTITSGAADFTTLGLPNATVTLGETTSAAGRVCKVTYSTTESAPVVIGDDNERYHDYLYSCFDSGVYTCSVFFKSPGN